MEQIKKYMIGIEDTREANEDYRNEHQRDHRHSRDRHSRDRSDTSGRGMYVFLDIIFSPNFYECCERYTYIMYFNVLLT